MRFFQRFAAGEAVNSIVKDLLHVPLWQRVVRWIERMLKCFLHKSRIKNLKRGKFVPSLHISR